MTCRRGFVVGLASGLIAAPAVLTSQPQDGFGLNDWRVGDDTRLGERWRNTEGATGVFEVPYDLRTREVRVPDEIRPGQIHVMARNNLVLWTLGNGRAIRYAAAMGEDGRQFLGEATVGRKEEWPSWTPTANMIRREPEYAKFVGGVAGGLTNPLGARALYLYRGGRDTRYRIHGTSQPWTIGQNVSSGCVRLFNHAILDLYERAPISTKVMAY